MANTFNPEKRMGERRYNARIYTASANRVSEEERRARQAAIPPDTRSITGFLLGDSLPGRSALDQESRQ